METFDPSDPVGPDFRDAVGKRIAAFIAARRRETRAIGSELDALVDLAATFTHGGKRLRPAFSYWGFVAVDGQQPSGLDPLLNAVGSLDLLHVSALMHDDVMDASDTRRGLPSAHRQLEALHHEAGLIGSAAAFGRAGAILLGDLLLVWSDEMLTTAGLEAGALDRARPVLAAVRTEVTCGQYLDVLAQASPWDRAAQPEAALAEVNRVVEFKTARYTVTRPLQLGAAIAAADPAQVTALAGYGSPLGRAFQYRDDLLGVFGEPTITGKPAGDDLREGKRTVLVHHALQMATPAAAARLAGFLGRSDLDDADIDRARRIIADSGARTATEREIMAGHDAAIAALTEAEFTAEGRIALTELARLAVAREF